MSTLAAGQGRESPSDTIYKRNATGRWLRSVAPSEFVSIASRNLSVIQERKPQEIYLHEDKKDIWRNIRDDIRAKQEAAPRSVGPRLAAPFVSPYPSSFSSGHILFFWLIACRSFRSRVPTLCSVERRHLTARNEALTRNISSFCGI